MTFKMSDPIHQRDISQSTLVSFKFISYFNCHFYTSIVIVTYEPFAFTPSERGKYSQLYEAREKYQETGHIACFWKPFGSLAMLGSLK